MPDRLPELLRQRALVQEHLAWLDREIAAAAAPAPTPNAAPVPAAGDLPATPNPKPQTPNSTAPAAAPAPDHEAEKILGQYRHDALSGAAQARRTLWILFAAGLGLVALVYFLYGLRLGRWW